MQGLNGCSTCPLALSSFLCKDSSFTRFPSTSHSLAICFYFVQYYTWFIQITLKDPLISPKKVSGNYFFHQDMWEWRWPDVVLLRTGILDPSVMGKKFLQLGKNWTNYLFPQYISLSRWLWPGENGDLNQFLSSWDSGPQCGGKNEKKTKTVPRPSQHFF